ncbi:MAG TPA: hypothetical protein PLS01_08350, partial [Clostridia bacterium]|nr:hypothetical protein [Clostridia bacterium]
ADNQLNLSIDDLIQCTQALPVCFPADNSANKTQLGLRDEDRLSSQTARILIGLPRCALMW